MRINAHKTPVAVAAKLMVERYGKSAARECSNRADDTENATRHEFWTRVWEAVEKIEDVEAK